MYPEEDEEFLQKMKFRNIEEGETERFENNDEFIARQIGYVSLYAAITQVSYE